jgi:hypothetical protein
MLTVSVSFKVTYVTLFIVIARFLLCRDLPFLEAQIDMEAVFY